MAHPLRIQRKRVAGWRMPEGAVYVGRPTIWGNPWSELRADAQQLFAGHAVDGILVGNFAAWLDHGSAEYRTRGESGHTFPIYVELHDRREEVLRRLPELRGKQLACWCSLDQPCHADVLCELANMKGGG